MKFLFIFITCLLLYTTQAEAVGRRHRYAGSPRTEAELMNRVLDCLRTKDTIGYYYLFPPLDTLWKMVTHNADQTPEAQRELNELRDHPSVLIDMDPFYNHSIIGRFAETLRKGEDSGINWNGIIMQRYELQKQSPPRGLEGLRRIAPERYKGFLFVRDMLSSTTFCITMTEIQKVNGYFCGGQVLNVIEANTIDEFLLKEGNERKYLAKMQRLEQQRKDDSARADTGVMSFAYRDSVRKDSIKTAKTKIELAGPQLPPDTAKMKRDLLLSSSQAVDEDGNKMRKEVVDRKLYKGKFDDEIPVELYVRYMKDANGKVSNWDGLYKFGDMPDYIKLEINKGEDGKWVMEEPVGIMELELADKMYTGSWTNGDNQTGYDVELVQKDLSQAKMMKLDRILENGAGGKTNEQTITEKKDIPEHRNTDNAKEPEKEKKKEETKPKDDPKKEESKPAEEDQKKDTPAEKTEPKKETPKDDD